MIEGPHRLAWVAVAAIIGGCGADPFERDAAPIFSRHCLECHSPDDPQGRLILSTRAAALAGGESGAVIVPGKPDESLLYQFVRDDEMPPDPNAKLTPEEKAALRAWIQQLK